MAIQDYAGLVEGVQKWCARSDSTFTNRIPDFVALAEERIYNGSDLESRGPLYSAPLRADVLETTALITFTAGVAPVPTGFLGFRKLARSGDALGLVYLPPERFAAREADAFGAYPSHFTIEGGDIKLIPSAWEGDLSATYWRQFDPLTTEDNSNALLVAHPMVYLTAALAEAFAFIQEADLSIAHVARLRSMIDGLNKTTAMSRTSGGTRRVTPRNPIP